ncbi:hypothetical protein DVH24_029949 [Malus domestica]|uniref:Uncharacterized protein n=1 Tax=Malus domestica TaxID=3750 RepID=A0A498HUF6_MALDO|nr:hypothetical protein DVH24_029949 [Malus domestica]
MQLRSIEFICAPRSCNIAAHLDFVVFIHGILLNQNGGVHTWDSFEPKWLFNTLTSDVNVAIRV